MAQSNHERVGKALEILNKGLLPFIEREMQIVYGARWLQEAANCWIASIRRRRA
jgi:hypothetical protein